MRPGRLGAALIDLLLLCANAAPAATLEERNQALFRQLEEVHGLTDAKLAEIRAIFARSGLGQGNPAIAQHPATPEQCRAQIGQQSLYSWFISGSDRAHEDWCRWRAPYWHGSRVMVPKSHANDHPGFRCCKTIGTR